jgi:hypothetical protein
MTIQDSDHACCRPLAVDPIAATDATLSRIDLVISLLLSASLSASSICGATSSEHERQQAASVSGALDEALIQQRILWVERYRDVARSEALTGANLLALRPHR